MRILPILLAAALFSCSHDTTTPIAPPTNRAPVIDSVVIGGVVSVGVPVDITCYAHDPDGDSLQYFWRVADGSIVGNGERVQLLAAPCCEGNSTTMQVTVRDRYQASDTREFRVYVW